MTAQIFNNPHLLDLLEWREVCGLISTHSHFKSTVSSKILVRPKKSHLLSILDQTKLFLDNYYEDSFQSIRISLSELDSDESFVKNIEKISKNGVCDLFELNEVAKIIEFYFKERKSFSFLNFKFKEGFNYNKTKTRLEKKFLKDFRSFVDDEGEYNYLNHPRLANIYKKILDKESFIRKSINESLNQLSERVQFNSYDVINDRFVIPIKSDSYSSNIGQIISRSETGNTLYVEPHKVKEQNYRRLELLHELDKEINNLTINYSRTLSEDYYFLSQLIYLVFHLDNYITRATYLNSNDFVLPEVSNSLNLKLKGAFHPLIKDCIKNDILLDSKKGLVISGPNTGGKTATLKMITIVSLLTQYGLAVPCSQASLSFYDSIYYFGNDQQNLNEGLSSFAGEVLSYNSMIESLKGESLIVIDEIFNSTSSEEASALAISLFNIIKEKSNAHIMVSTHHQMLKSLIHQQDEFLSAHVGFDSQSGKPTYRLSYGSPGGSQALSIFKQLSKDQEFADSIIKNASKLLDKKMISYEALLEKISIKENELNKLELENKKINQELKNQKAAVEGVLKLKLDDKLKRADEKIKNIFEKAQNLLKDIKSGKQVSSKQINNQKSLIKSELNKISPKKEVALEAAYKGMKSPDKLVIGEKYFSVQLKQTVTLKKLNTKKGVAQVSKGALTIPCKIESLRVSNQTSESNRNSINSFKTSGDFKVEYDCRGMRLEEFQSLAETLTGELLAGQIPFVTMIHGHGTGALKGWLRKFIKNNKHIQMVVNESGNDGETKFKLKD